MFWEIRLRMYSQKELSKEIILTSLPFFLYLLVWIPLFSFQRSQRNSPLLDRLFVVKFSWTFQTSPKNMGGFIFYSKSFHVSLICLQHREGKEESPLWVGFFQVIYTAKKEYPLTFGRIFYDENPRYCLSKDYLHEAQQYLFIFIFFTFSFMQYPSFDWVHTALVTPFTRSGTRVDYPNLHTLIDTQIAWWVAWVVPVGTTGESPTLSPHEHERVIAETVERVSGRLLVIGGIGSNNTREAIHYAKVNERVWADAWLSVVPYYNKPNQEWLYRHFRAQAESTELPIILYSIPGRSGAGIELAIPTILRLARDCRNIIGIKEAGGNLERFRNIRLALDSAWFSEFVILSGDDGLTLPAMKDGSASGVISVASNIIPREIIEMVSLANEWNIAQAEVLAARYQKLFEALFMTGEPNPQATKYILSQMEIFGGRFQNVLRLPLIPVSDTSRPILDQVMREYGMG